MKTIYRIFCLLTFVMIIGCQHNNKSAQQPEKLSKDMVIKAAKEYFMNRLKNPIEGENEGLIRIQGDQEVCIFSRDKIFAGKLDKDETEDAIVTYGYQKTGEMAVDRHLILLNDSVLHVVNDFPYAMTIQGITAGTVVAKVDTGKRYLNVAPCASCQEVRQFILAGDSLVAVKNE